MFAFFSDYMGVSSSAACFSPKVHQASLTTIQKAKEALNDKNISFLDSRAPDLRITLKKDNTFIIRRGFSISPQGGNNGAPRRIPEKITGILYPDRIVVDRIDFGSPNAEFISSVLGKNFQWYLCFTSGDKRRNPEHRI